MHQCLARPWQKARATNATDTSFSARPPTITEPSGDGVVGLAGPAPGGVAPGRVVFIPYGAGDDDDVFDLRLLGWRRVGSGAGPADVLWVPTILAQFTCTMGTAVGVAGAPVVATERFCDTIVIHATITAQLKSTDTDGAGAASTGHVLVCSPANNLVAHAVVLTEGCEKVELLFDMTTGDPTNGNCLVSFF